MSYDDVIISDNYADRNRARAMAIASLTKAWESSCDIIGFCATNPFQGRDAQLRTLLTMETRVAKETLKSILVYGGFPLSAGQVVSAVVADRGVTS